MYSDMDNPTPEPTLEEQLERYERALKATFQTAVRFLLEWLHRYAPDASSVEVIRSADTGEYLLGEIRDSNNNVLAAGWSTPYIADFADIVGDHGWKLLKLTTGYVHEGSLPCEDETNEMSIHALASLGAAGSREP